MPTREKAPFLLTPLPYLFAYVFLLLTSFHQSSYLLKQLRIELVLTLVILSTAVLNIYLFQTVSLTREAKLLTVLSLMLMGAPLLSSWVNGGEMQIAFGWEYASWVKILVVAPLLYLFCNDENGEQLINFVFLAMALLAVVFWYRYAYLGEVREFDQRPTLHMKNGDPNFLAVMFATLLPLVLYRFTLATKPFRVGALLGYGSLFLLYLSCVIASESRMGILSLGIALIYLVFTLPRAFRKPMLLGALLIGIAMLTSEGVWERFASMADESNRTRVKTLLTGVMMFSNSPLFGHGWGSAVEHYFQYGGYARLMSEGRAMDIHNTPLQLLAELGLYGFLAYAGLFLFTLKAIHRGPRMLSTFSTAAFIVLCLNLLTLPLQSKDFVILLVVCLAAINEQPSPKRWLPSAS